MTKKLTNDQFIEKVKRVHGDKYDYSKVYYQGVRSKVIIVCPKHGEFQILAGNLLKGSGCPKCAYIKTTEDFIEKAKEVWGDTYDYSKSTYTGSRNKIEIICPKHGSFFIRPSAHIYQHQGCHKCSIEKNSFKARSTSKEFIEKARRVHGDRYDYSKINYINRTTPVTIICPIHGEFQQTPRDHLDNCGCQICNLSKGELKVQKLIESKGINYIPQFHSKFLGLLSYDFYLPDFKIAIEYNGKQHYVPIEYFGGNKKLLEQQQRDNRKANISSEQGIKLIIINCNNDEDDIRNLSELLDKLVAQEKGIELTNEQYN